MENTFKQIIFLLLITVSAKAQNCCTEYVQPQNRPKHTFWGDYKKEINDTSIYVADGLHPTGEWVLCHDGKLYHWYDELENPESNDDKLVWATKVNGRWVVEENHGENWKNLISKVRAKAKVQTPFPGKIKGDTLIVTDPFKVHFIKIGNDVYRLITYGTSLEKIENHNVIWDPPGTSHIYWLDSTGTMINGHK